MTDLGPAVGRAALAVLLLVAGAAAASPEGAPSGAAGALGSPPGPWAVPLKAGASGGPFKPETKAAGPSPFVFVPTVPADALAGIGTSRPEPLAPGKGPPIPLLQSGTTAKPGAEVERAPLPGTFRPEAAATPSPFARTQMLDQRTKPDLEVGVSERTTVGVFSEAGTIERTDIRNSTVRETRDLGAGVTLQYKFGQ